MFKILWSKEDYLLAFNCVYYYEITDYKVEIEKLHTMNYIIYYIIWILHYLFRPYSVFPWNVEAKRNVIYKNHE